jgi:hypothetical protein
VLSPVLGMLVTYSVQFVINDIAAVRAGLSQPRDELLIC